MRLDEKDELQTESPDQPSAREKWFRKGRISPDKAPAADWLNRAFQQKMQLRLNRAMVLRNRSQHAGATLSATVPVGNGGTSWVPLGPAPIMPDGFAVQDYGPMTGRATTVAVDPSDPSGNTVAVGGAYGGVWLSRNAAAADKTTVTWQPIFDDQASLAVGSMSWKPDGTVLLVGTGEGDSAVDSYYGVGLFRSTNDGSTWTQIPYSADGHSFRGMAIQRMAWSRTQGKTNVVAVSTMLAARDFTAKASGYNALAGVYFSTDSGATWNASQFFDSTVQIINAPSHSVVWNPGDHKFYAELRYHGIYVSRNADDPSIFDRLAKQPDLPAIGLNSPTTCPPDYLSGACPIFRGEIAANPIRNELYVWWIKAPSTHKGIWKSTDSGTTWTQLSDASGFVNCSDPTFPGEAGCGATQSFYNMTVLAVPNPSNNNLTDLYVGSVNLYKCTIDPSATGANATCGGTSEPNKFMNLTHVYGCANGGDPAHVHPDHHDMSVVPGNSAIIYFAHDGGISRTVASANLDTGSCAGHNAFDNLNYNMGSMTQFVWGTPIPNDIKGIFAGSQDNGSSAIYSPLSTNGSQGWIQVDGGDGGYNDIDPLNTNNWYGSNIFVSISRCTAGTNCRRDQWGSSYVVSNGGKTPDIPDASAFYAPFMLDPQLSSQLLIGTCRIWRGPTGRGATGWLGAPISPMFTNAGTCTGNDFNVTSIAAGGGMNSTNTGSKVIWATMENGSVWRTLDSAVTPVPVWTASTPFAGALASSVAVDPGDSTGQTAYVTLQTFGVPHVWETKDAGNTWIPALLNSGLPDAPFNNVVVDPDDSNVIYLATDVGVYSCDQSINSNFVPACLEVGPDPSTGNIGFLPNVVALRIAIQKTTNPVRKMLRAITYGRGVWSADITYTSGPAVTFSPVSIDFGSTYYKYGSNGGLSNIFYNSGGSDLIVSSVILSDPTDYSIILSNCGTFPLTLTPGAGCPFLITFTPQSLGTINATLTVNSNASPSTAVANMTGVALARAMIQVTPDTYSFPATQLGSATTKTFTVTNVGLGADLTISGYAPWFPSAFSILNDHCSGVPLAVGSTCTFDIQFVPTTGGENSAAINVLSNDPQSFFSQTVRLQGLGAQTTGTLSPTTMTFAPQAVGTTSATQTATFTNTGSSNLIISGVGASAPFVSGGTCTANPVTILPGNSCAITVSFQPTAPGAIKGSVQFFHNSTATNSIALSGTALGPSIDTQFNGVSVTQIGFGGQRKSTSSPEQQIQVKNTGTTDLHISSLAIGGMNAPDYAIGSNSCAVPVSPGTTCLVGVKLTPTTTGLRVATLNITSDAVIGNGVVAMSGDGTYPSLAVDSTSFDFGTVKVNKTSSTQTFALNNIGSDVLNIASVTASGPFRVVNHCGNSVPKRTTCNLDLTFTPAAQGSASGTVTITHDLGVTTLTLIGSGVAANATAGATSIAFAGKPLTSTTTQTVDLTNTGQASLTVTVVSVTGSSFSQTNNCGTLPATIAPGAKCTFSVSFTPTATGVANGTLAISHDGANASPLNVGLTGTGEDFAAPASSPTSASVSAGGSASFTISVVPSGGNFSSPVNFSCQSPLPLGVNCSFAPASVTPAGSSATTTLTISTLAPTGTHIGTLHSNGQFRLASLVLLFGLPAMTVFVARRNRKVGFGRLTGSCLMLLTAALILGLVSCGGGGGSSGGGGSPGTPAGSYNIAVTASSGSLSHSTQISLTVR